MQPESVVVRAPLPAVRRQLRPENLRALVPGLATGASGDGTLRLWRPGGVSTHDVRLRPADDGDGALLHSVAGAPVGFRLSLAALAAPGDVPPRCLLEGRVCVEPGGADAVAAAALRHALLRLVPEIAAAAEHALTDHAGAEPEDAESEDAESAADERPARAALPRGSRAAAVVAAAVLGAVVAAAVVRRRAGKRERRS